MKSLTKVFWLFGRSGAGKTTLALRLRDGLLNRKIPVVYLDGDEMRSDALFGFRLSARGAVGKSPAHCGNRPAAGWSGLECGGVHDGTRISTARSGDTGFGRQAGMVLH